MKIFIFSILFILILLTNAIAQPILTTNPYLASTAWPMIKHDPQQTGRTNIKGPQTAQYIKKIPLIGGVFSGPIIGFNDHIYTGTEHAGTFYSLTPLGSEEWVYNTSIEYMGVGGALLSKDTVLFFGSFDKYLYALNADGTLKWNYNIGAFISAQSSINTDDIGNIYFTALDGYLYSFSKEGILNWKYKDGNGFSHVVPAVSKDYSSVYITGHDSNLYSISVDGLLNWKVYLDRSGSPAVTDDNKILVGSTDGIYSFNADGSFSWKYQTDIYIAYEGKTSPSLDNMGNIFIAAGAKITSLDKNGDFRWDYIFEKPGDRQESISQPLVIDKEGTVYCGSTFGFYYYAINNDGTLKWKIPLDDAEVDNTAAIDSKGNLIIGVHGSGPVENNGIWIISDDSTITGIEEPKVFGYSLYQNYPNPFNPLTKIRFEIPISQFVELKIFDILGREVRTLYSDIAPAGVIAVDFKADDLASGIYVYRLNTGNQIFSRKLMLMK